MPVVQRTPKTSYLCADQREVAWLLAQQLAETADHFVGLVHHQQKHTIAIPVRLDVFRPWPAASGFHGSNGSARVELGSVLVYEGRDLMSVPARQTFLVEDYIVSYMTW